MSRSARYRIPVLLTVVAVLLSLAPATSAAPPAKDKNSPIVAYCGNPRCQAYQAAAKAASKLGYKNVKHMSAGIAGWKEAGEKIEKGESKKDS